MPGKEKERSPWMTNGKFAMYSANHVRSPERMKSPIPFVVARSRKKPGVAERMRNQKNSF